MIKQIDYIVACDECGKETKASVPGEIAPELQGALFTAEVVMNKFFFVLDKVYCPECFEAQKQNKSILSKFTDKVLH